MTAASELIDRKGEAQLTMRRLGAALNVSAMSLYQYFPSRRTLLDAVAESAASEAAMGPSAHPALVEDWRDHLSTLAHRVRQFALGHPRLFLLIATHPTAAPWLRPPICSLPSVELFMERLETAHFPPTVAAAAYKQFCAFLLGHLLPEVALTGLNPGPAAAVLTPLAGATSRFDSAPGFPQRHRVSGDHRTSDRAPPQPASRNSAVGSQDLAGRPHVAALAGLLGADTYAADFDRDLHQVLAGLARLLRR